MQGHCGVVTWIWVGSYLVWIGSWQMILVKAQESLADIQDQSRTGQRSFISEPEGMAPSLPFFRLLEPLNIFLSRLFQALWGPTDLCLHMYIYIFYLIFCLPGFPGNWFRSFKSHFHKPYLLHAPLTANISSLTQRAAVFVEVAMTQTCLHWCPLWCEKLPRKL